MPVQDYFALLNQNQNPSPPIQQQQRNGLVALQQNDIQTVTQLLGVVQGWLRAWDNVTTAQQYPNAAREFLPLVRDANFAYFRKGVDWLKTCVAKYLAQGQGGWGLNVARMNVPGALASSVPVQNAPWLDIREAESVRRGMTLILQPSFELPYLVGQVQRQLTPHGRATTLLHELTHATSATVDLTSRNDQLQPYIKGTPETGNVYTPDACRQCAQATQLFTHPTERRNYPISWWNAENWTRALMIGPFPQNEPPEFQ